MSRPLGEDDIPVAVPIILAKPDHKFELNVRALERILLRDDVKDRCVVVLSVAGTFRKGKSFLLDFFLRYVKSQYSKAGVKPDWMGSPCEPLIGFPWRGGSERDTAGILMWSEVFLTTLPGNQKVAILLLDTQGTFDSESTVKDCATIFALSTMISSIQIYNLSQNIQEDDLQHLQLFTEYGRLALADSGEKPFQKLQLLVRDWSYPYEAPYGEDGGKTVLEKRLKISEKQHPELQSIRNHVRSCFKEICCFLLPHPGLKVATNPNFDGRLSDIEPDFLKHISEFVPLLMSPKYLTLKAINGQQVKAKELLQYFKSYINIYGGDDLPEPKSLLLATAEANNLAAVAAAKEVYHSKMEAICGGDKAYLSTNALETHHLTIKTEALQEFSRKKKMGGSEFSEKYKTKLDTDIDTMYTEFQLHNNRVFDIIGIGMLVFVCNLSLALAMVTLVTWAYCRYTGELTEVSQAIDNIAGGIWEEAMKPTYQKVTGKMVERVVESAVTQSTRPSATADPKA